MHFYATSSFANSKKLKVKCETSTSSSECRATLSGAYEDMVGCTSANNRQLIIVADEFTKSHSLPSCMSLCISLGTHSLDLCPGPAQLRTGKLFLLSLSLFPSLSLPFFYQAW